MRSLLAGLVVCGACGRQCHSHKDKIGTRRWICPHRSGKRRTCLGESYASIRVDLLDEWVLDYLAPMLGLEIDEARQERLSSPIQADLRSKEARLSELKDLEINQLKRALKCLDDAAFSALAASLRQEREHLELEVSDIRRVVASENYHQRMDPAELWSKDRTAIKVALTRYLRWICLTDKGVIAYSVLNTPTAGRFIEKDLSAYNTTENFRKIESPDLEAWIDCQDWIANKEAFASGRRYALGTYGDQLSIEALVPDWAGPTALVPAA